MHNLRQTLLLRWKLDRRTSRLLFLRKEAAGVKRFSAQVSKGVPCPSRVMSILRVMSASIQVCAFGMLALYPFRLDMTDLLTILYR